MSKGFSSIARNALEKYNVRFSRNSYWHADQDAKIIYGTRMPTSELELFAFMHELRHIINFTPYISKRGRFSSEKFKQGELDADEFATSQLDEHDIELSDKDIEELESLRKQSGMITDTKERLTRRQE